MSGDTEKLIAMLRAITVEDGCTIFEHTAEEIGLVVLENYQAVLTALIAASPKATETRPVLAEADALEVLAQTFEDEGQKSVGSYIRRGNELIPDQPIFVKAMLRFAALSNPAPVKGNGECPNSPSGRHQVDTTMESGPNNCFYCEQPMDRPTPPDKA